MMITINEISLSNTNDFVAYPVKIPHTAAYWIQTNKSDNSGMIVSAGSSSDCRVDKDDVGVRPVLSLTVESNTWRPGEKMDIFGMKWTVLYSQRNNVRVFCDDIVAKRRFDSKNNKWETSELKAWLEEWIEYVAMGLDDISYKSVSPRFNIGDICKVGKYDMIILDEHDGNCMLLAKDLYREYSTFGDNNNFRGSNANKICAEFAKEIEDIVGSENIIEHVVDLTAHDGSKDYGVISCMASLMTEKMYIQHKDILKDYALDNWWWLATPQSASRYGVSCVSPDGDVGDDYCDFNDCGVRPFCILKSSILVS